MLWLGLITLLRAASQRRFAPDKDRELYDDDKDEARTHLRLPSLRDIEAAWQLPSTKAPIACRRAAGKR